MIQLARKVCICLALAAAFGIGKGFIDQGESYIDFSAIGIVKGAAIFFATVLICVVAWIVTHMHIPQNDGGFK